MRIYIRCSTYYDTYYGCVYLHADVRGSTYYGCVYLHPDVRGVVQEPNDLVLLLPLGPVERRVAGLQPYVIGPVRCMLYGGMGVQQGATTCTCRCVLILYCGRTLIEPVAPSRGACVSRPQPYLSYLSYDYSTVYSRTPSLRLVSAPASIRISATPGCPPMAQQCSAETLSDRLCRGKRGV